ncbi:MAG: ABC transporter permease subunit [Pseudomonadota bacterium]
MWRYIGRRLLGAVPTVFIVITVAFFMMRLAPGGPFLLDRPLPDQIMENLMRVYQLDQPLWVQYTSYLKNIIRGDFGPSLIYRDFTVAELIAGGLPVSIQFGVSALLIALGLGTLLGTLAALYQNRGGDYLVMGVATFGMTIPNFVVAPVLSFIFGIALGWLPTSGWGDGTISYKVLPIICLMLPQMAIITRLTRAGMIEVLRSEPIRTAHAKGLPTRVVLTRHALRGAILPVISYLGPAAAALLTGSVVIETIFGVPGIGRYFVQGALNRDYTLVMGTVLLISVFILLFNLLVDIIYSVLDPRVIYDD